MAALRHALMSFLEHWRDDLGAPWRTVLAEVEPAFDAVATGLTLLDSEVILPGRKGAAAPGARKDSHVFRVLDSISPVDVRAVVLGQDPYPNASRATGRAFEQGDLTEWSPNKQVVAESLRRIVQVVAHARTGKPIYREGDQSWGATANAISSGELSIPPPRELFDHWQSQGVLFLNAGLTLSRFEKATQAAHIAMWQPVVQGILRHLATRPHARIVFLLWGGIAKTSFEKLGVLQAAQQAGMRDQIAVAEHAHPGAEQQGSGNPLFFAGVNPLLDANEQLTAIGGAPIDW